MNFNELTRARYSLRKFDPRPIEEEKLRLLLQAAQSAPTAHNNQPQYLLVCKSPDALARVDRCTTMHFGAPVVLVVCYDPAAAWVRTGIDGKNHGEIDATIAVTQMMLQAADLGLGTTYVGMFDPEKLTAAFNRGYRSFAAIYTACTDSAVVAEERYRNEGATLATEITARFGN